MDSPPAASLDGTLTGDPAQQFQSGSQPAGIVFRAVFEPGPPLSKLSPLQAWTAHHCSFSLGATRGPHHRLTRIPIPLLMVRFFRTAAAGTFFSRIRSGDPRTGSRTSIVSLGGFPLYSHVAGIWKIVMPTFTAVISGRLHFLGIQGFRPLRHPKPP